MALLAPLLQSASSQVPLAAPAAPAPVALVSGRCDGKGALPWSAFGLGNGGIAAVRVGAQEHAMGLGEVRTPGGVLLRAKLEGVKLDFPSGAEVMITPSLRICLRGGEQTLPALGRLVLAFTDGSALEVEPSNDPRLPIRRATLVTDQQRTVFWPPAQGVVIDAGHRRGARVLDDPLLVLGDGRAVYQPVPLGPILGLRAVLRPRDDERFAAERFVIAGDLLASSLQRLPGHVPPTPVQFPQAPQAAQRLAEMSAALFAPGDIERAARTRGPLVLSLAQEWRLQVEIGAATGLLTLGLYRADASVPAVEWTVTPTRTELHLVRPSGGENGGPRYFLRGIDLNDEVRALWPWKASADDRRWAENELLRFGARSLRDRALIAPQTAR